MGQLAKLISKRPRCSLSNEEGLVGPEPESRQGIVVSKSKGEKDHSEQTPETHSKNTPEPWSSNDKGPTYEERRLQVEELDDWQTQKPRSHDKPKQRHDELNISPNQLKVGDKVLLDAADLRIATSKPNGEIPLTVFSIFPYSTAEVIHPKFVWMRSVNSTYHHDHVTERFSRTTQLGTRACLGSCPYHRKQHSRAIWPCENKAKFFPNTGVDKLPRPYDMAMGESVKTTQAFDTPVSRGYGCN
ncbi:hypothetical protein GOBAR_AA37345 [Gossypium barbadense]|uniref:Uncharacterized protein n=1 Tax=Gossypium barbadense TaxID=3634 RepID=A0A2P5VX34_GOSBA|nr:hypothetical protein GOBAR_AA37345 [Gossypium barbadense]